MDIQPEEIQPEVRSGDRRSGLKLAILKLLVVMVAIVGIGLSTVDQYGVSWDEPYGVNSVWLNINRIVRNQPIPGVFEYDGTVFNFASEAVFQVQKRVKSLLPGSTNSQQKTAQNSASENALMRDRLQSKHGFTFLTSLLIYLSVAAIVAGLWSLENAWLGVVTLAFFPRFWGYSFFNFKDIPFALIFTLCTIVGAYLVDRTLRAETVKWSWNPLIQTAIGFGVLVGLLTGVRAGGFVVIAFPWLAFLVVGFLRDRQQVLKQVPIVLPISILTLVVSFATATLCYPSSWSNPIVWFYRALRALSSYDWDGKVLFNGQFYSPQTLPWYYIPTWIGLMVPVVFLVGFTIGLVVLLKKYPQFSTFQQALVVLVLMQIFLLPLLTIVRRSIIYGEIRHFMFIMPAIAAIAAIGLLAVFQAFPQRAFKLATVTLLIVLLVNLAWEIVALHPYQYVYFNRIFGGLTAANQRFETDFWGLSLREGMEWLNQNGDRALPVLIGGPTESASVFAAPEFKILPFMNRQAPANLTKPFYYLSMYGGNRQFQSYFEECSTLHQITREQTPLSLVRRCD